MEEELEWAFELGRQSNMLRRYISLLGITGISTQRQSFTNTYLLYQEFARKLDIRLPDEPAEETSETEMKQFYSSQMKCVEEHLFRYKSKRVMESYETGDCFNNLHVMFHACKATLTSDPSLHEKSMPGLTKLLRELKRHAKSLGADISKECEMLYNFNQSLDDDHEDEITTFEREFKKKIFKVEEKRSKLDPSREITDDRWVVSLVRLPDKSSQHAFLVLEGNARNNSMIWFADFVTNDPNDSFRPGMREGRVRLDYYENRGDSPSELLFRCPRTMMKIQRGDRVLYSTWPIPKATAEILIQNIKTQKNSPPKYNILGDSMLAGSSATSSNNPIGHNCFTFARMMLLNLNDQYIEIPQDKLGVWIASATSRNLPDKLLDRSWWNGVRFALWVFIILGPAIVVIAYIIQKLL